MEQAELEMVLHSDLHLFRGSRISTYIWYLFVRQFLTKILSVPELRQVHPFLPAGRPHKMNVGQCLLMISAGIFAMFSPREQVSKKVPVFITFIRDRISAIFPSPVSGHLSSRSVITFSFFIVSMRTLLNSMQPSCLIL